MKSRLSNILICFTIFWSLLDALPVEAGDKPLLFLGNRDIPPMIYQTEQGPKGIVIDLAKAIIDKSGLNAKVNAIDWGAAQEKLRTGSADALLQINSNPEREKIFIFSEPLLLSEFSIFRHSSRIDLQNIESLYGRSVGVEKKGYPLSLLKKHPKINIVIIPSWRSGFEKVSKGEIDAVVVDRWVGEFELSKLELTNIVVNKKPIETSHSTIAVRKGQDELLAKINDGIKKIRSDGSYDRILSNWQSYEVIYLTREQSFVYIASFVLAFFFLIIVGGVVYVRQIMADSRSQSDLNRRLENRNNELLQFAYRTSHDLKSPLTSSKQLLRFIVQDIEAGNTAEATKNAKSVEKQMMRLEKLITNVLDMTSAEFKEHEFEAINFVEVFQDIKERLTLNLDEKACDITLADLTNQPIHLPRARLTQIVENVVSNGIKYRDKDKQKSYVRVTTSNEPNYLVITIEDNGLGIPEAHQDKVFDMFQRFHPEIKDGSGLGLNIVHKHIEVLNGAISVTSTEGQGACFKIRIPNKAEQ